jgi:hypothetical protein
VSITDFAPAVTGERLFPTCAPWCAWHYAEDTPENPGSCWAEDIEVPGAVEVMATWDEQRTVSVYAWPNGTGEDAEPVVTEEPRPPLSITAFRTDRPNYDDGITFTTLDQAEATAHALLAMVARIRGDEQLAAVHLTASLPHTTQDEAAR